MKYLGKIIFICFDFLFVSIFNQIFNQIQISIYLCHTVACYLGLRKTGEEKRICRGILGKSKQILCFLNISAQSNMEDYLWTEGVFKKLTSTINSLSYFKNTHTTHCLIQFSILSQNPYIFLVFLIFIMYPFGSSVPPFDLEPTSTRCGFTERT